LSTAIYPGSFDPITYGHMDVIDKAQRAFDKVVICVGVNQKKTPTFTPQYRCDLIKELYPDCDVITWNGLIVEAAKHVGAAVIVRGFRALADFEAEFRMAHINKRLAPDIDTVMFPTSEETTFYSSSIAKELAMVGAPLIDIVPASVERALRDTFRPVNIQKTPR